MFKDAQGNLTGSGLFDGNAHQLLNQGTGVLIAWVLAGVGTLVLLKLVDLTVGLRVTDDDEVRGLDLTQHGEEGYSLELGGAESRSATRMEETKIMTSSKR